MQITPKVIAPKKFSAEDLGGQKVAQVGGSCFGQPGVSYSKL